MVELKSKREIELMREAGRLVAETLELLKKEVKPGIKTKELDKMAEDFIHQRGAGRRAGFQGLSRLSRVGLRLHR
jgi:methionyl aminopeptidase